MDRPRGDGRSLAVYVEPGKLVELAPKLTELAAQFDKVFLAYDGELSPKEILEYAQDAANLIPASQVIFYHDLRRYFHVNRHRFGETLVCVGFPQAIENAVNMEVSECLTA